MATMKLQIGKGRKLFFTSDTHYAHKNICKGVTSWKDSEGKTREFKTLDQMNSAIVDNINSVVGQDDYLVHLGDWSFGGFEKIEEFRNRIVCKNVILVLGNHDHHIKNNRGHVKDLFYSVHSYLELIVEDLDSSTSQMLVLQHFPICSWIDMNKGCMHLFGHVHLPSNKKMMPGRSMDVGVDGNSMKPYEYREVIKLLRDRPVKNNVIEEDHHESEPR